MGLLILLLLLAGGVAPAQPNPAGFRYAGSIPVPFVPGFAATAPDGRLAITSFNEGSSSPVSAYIVTRPASDFTPVPFDAEPFGPRLGYTGVAFDAIGSVFLVGDTGDAATCFLRKYSPTLERDEAFGSRGEVRGLGLRAMGCAVLFDKLLVASTWGTIAVFDAVTGAFVGLLPGDSASRIRDLAAETNAQQVFGLGEGALFWWNGGTSANLGAYRFSQLGPKRHGGSLLEGIAYHPPLRSVYYAFRNPVEVRVSNGANDASVLGLAGVPAMSDVCDITFSADYQVMYVTDPGRRAIHYAVFEGAVQPQIPFGGLVGQPLGPPPAGGAGSPLGTDEAPRFRLRAVQKEWYTTLSSLALDATAQNKKMGIYFRSERSRQCLDLEAALFAGPPLFEKFPTVLWARIDVADSPALAEDFSIIRVPALVIIDELGETIDQITDELTEERIRRSLSR